MTKPLENVLFICKQENKCSKLSAQFEMLENFCVEFAVVNKTDATALMKSRKYDLFILDFDIHGEQTIDILNWATETDLQKPILVIADEKDTHFYLKSINAGAADFLIKQQIEIFVLERAIINSINQRQILAELVETRSKFQDLVEHLPAMFYISEIAPPYKQHYASPLFAMLGYEIEEWLQEQNIWQSVLHPDDREWVLKQTGEAMNSGNETNYEYRIIAKDGTVFWVHDRGHFYHSKDGQKIFWQGLMTDITDRKIAQQQLFQKAMFDELTGLPNRRTFVERLAQRIDKSRRECSPKFAVFILDLDRFKLINDTLGHLTADKFLIEVGRRFREIIEPVGMVGRLSGDEFAVLIDDANNLEEIKKVASRLQRSVAETFVYDGFEFSSTVSIGITVSDENQTKPEHFLRNADVAMYHSKSLGKNRFEFFDLEIYEKNMRKLRFENDLRYALERKEFSLQYQPIVSLKTGKIEKLEALLCWEHPSMGFIAPEEFIPIAEESGLINPIGRWVLEHACQQLKYWQTIIPGQKELSIAVNISVKQTVKRQFVEDLKDILKKENIEPQYLYLEITETALMENADLSTEIIENIYDLGIKLSTDDFGTGYSSLSYLHRFPFAELKIDRSFISTFDTNSKSQKIVRTIINMAQSLNLKTVAEGIETKEQLEQLQKSGCDFGQGFYFTKAVSASEIELILTNGFQTVNTQHNFNGLSDRAENTICVFGIQ